MAFKVINKYSKQTETTLVEVIYLKSKLTLPVYNYHPNLIERLRNKDKTTEIGYESVLEIEKINCTDEIENPIIQLTGETFKVTGKLITIEEEGNYNYCDLYLKKSADFVLLKLTKVESLVLKEGEFLSVILKGLKLNF